MKEAMDPSRPLDGFTVVELGHSVAAPFAGQILADLGAQVIKVEKPEGDDARKWGPPFVDGAAVAFQALNRGKKSVLSKLRDPQEIARLKTLILERADVVIQNLRPGQVDKLGIGADELLALKPSLVYCNMGAFGATGPLADRPGYDPLMQAYGGIMSINGHAGQPPARVPVSMVDMGTGMWAVTGILAALRERDRTGRGAHVTTALFDTALAWSVFQMSHYFATGEVPRPQGSGTAIDRKSTRLNSSHIQKSRMPSSA